LRFWKFHAVVFLVRIVSQPLLGGTRPGVKIPLEIAWVDIKAKLNKKKEPQYPILRFVSNLRVNFHFNKIESRKVLVTAMIISKLGMSFRSSKWNIFLLFDSFNVRFKDDFQSALRSLSTLMFISITSSHSIECKSMPFVTTHIP